MKKIFKWVKDNWEDPVWSKVIAGIILGILAAIGTLAVTLCKKIPIADLYEKATSSYIKISFFEILIAVVVLLTFLIPAFSMDFIRFQLKRGKVSDKLKSQGINLEQFLRGQWLLTYTNPNPAFSSGNESVTFVNGNQYFIRGQLSFIMTDIDFNSNKKELVWTKTIYANNKKHATETLKIVDDNIMEGTDDLGYTLKYIKTN
ncbi:MAG: hypothetical protein HY062_18325 [Bacteroidetes bacterium]|nr:hypothetical protein [Bacteroidota bacterium]